MSEVRSKIYISQTYTAGYLHSCAEELNLRTRDVAAGVVERVTHIDRSDRSDIELLRLRAATCPGGLPLNEREKWFGAEMDVFKLLRAISSFKSSQTAFDRLSEQLPQHLPFADRQEALEYFTYTQERLEFLLSRKGMERLDCLRYAALSYSESLIMKAAIFNGVCLTKFTHRHSIN